MNRPGSYELLSGEKLYDIIQLAMGIAKDAYLENIEIVRFVSSSDDTEILSKSLAEILKNPKSSENILLQPDDHIFVKQMKDYHLHQSVSISGEVKFPSIFTIEEGKTRLLDIIEKAGGVTADADLSLGQIIRQMWIAKEDNLIGDDLDNPMPLFHREPCEFACAAVGVEAVNAPVHQEIHHPSELGLVDVAVAVQRDHVGCEYALQTARGHRIAL